MNRTATRFGVAATVANAVGLALAVYLTVEHYSASPSYLCPATSVLNCQKVTESSYAVVFGVPVALAGLVYFVASIPLHLPAAWRSTSVWVCRARWVWVAVGMVSVFWLIHGELELGAICLYCTGVHVVTFGLFVLTLIGSALVVSGETAVE